MQDLSTGFPESEEFFDPELVPALIYELILFIDRHERSDKSSVKHHQQYGVANNTYLWTSG